MRRDPRRRNPRAHGDLLVRPMIRLIRSLLPSKCHICLEWHQNMPGHLNYDHFGEALKPIGPMGQAYLNRLERMTADPVLLQRIADLRESRGEA